MPGSSILHRLDPRSKLLMGLILITAAIMAGGMISLLLLFLTVLAGLILSRVQLRLAFIPIRRVFPFLIVLAAIQMFAVPQFRENAVVLWNWKFLLLTDRSLMSGLLLIGRFIVIVNGLSLFSFTTSTTEFIHGVEHVLRPFQRIRFPAHEAALVVNISIRFIPILTEEAERLMKAQASRGADFGTGRRGFLKRFRKMLPLFVPMFILSLRHAQNLGEAMESRCYMGGEGRTHLIQLHAEIRDYVAVTTGLCVFAAAIVLSRLRVDARVLQGLIAIMR
jgi:energy-coupling factor transport system permease protein